MTEAAVMGGDKPSLATKCLDLCQALISQGRAFTFNLSVDSSFTFSLDTRGEVTPAKTMARKKTSPSTQRRNKKRKDEFLLKKSQTISEKSPGKDSEKETDLKTNTETKAVDETTVDKEPPVQKPPASQPWRRQSTCKRCGVQTKGHPGPYGEERCRVSLHHLPSIRIEKCSDCMDHLRPPCDAHRKPWMD